MNTTELNYLFDHRSDPTALSSPMQMPEELHRLGNIRRSKPADEAAWAQHCPCPEGWIVP